MTILVIRFSAFGDVLLTVPVIKAAASQNPQHKFVVLSRSVYSPYFDGLPSNVVFCGVDLKDHQVNEGVLRIFRKIRSEYSIDAVADFHNVSRTIKLDLLFALSFIPVARLNKQRLKRFFLVSFGPHRVSALKPSFEKYRDVLLKLGVSFELRSELRPTREHSDCFKVGVAPFAAHPGKIYPLEKMKKVVKALSEHPSTEVYLFGSPSESSLMSDWVGEHVHCIAGTLSRKEELDFISGLDVMLCMDSSNMHIASLVGVPVVSVWGATHPFAGFLGWGQSIDDAVQIDLPCRPCSIFGKKKCRFGSYPCLSDINEGDILEKVYKYEKQNW